MEKRQFFGQKDWNYVLGMPIERNCDLQTMFDCAIRDVLKIEGCLDDNLMSCLGVTCIDWNPLRTYTIAEVIEDTPLPEICMNGEPTLLPNASYMIGKHPLPELRHYSAEKQVGRIFDMAMKAIERNNACETRYVQQLHDNNIFNSESNLIRDLYNGRKTREKVEFLEFLFAGFGDEEGYNNAGSAGMWGDPMYGNQEAFTCGELTEETPSTILYGNELASTDHPDGMGGVVTFAHADACPIDNPLDPEQVNAQLFIDAIEVLQNQRLINGDLACLNSCPKLLFPHKKWKQAVTKIFGITGQLASGCCMTSNMCGKDISTYVQDRNAGANEFSPFLLEGYEVQIMFTDWLNDDRLKKWNVNLDYMPDDMIDSKYAGRKSVENMFFLLDSDYLNESKTILKLCVDQEPIRMYECKNGTKSYIIDYFSGMGNMWQGVGLVVGYKFLK